jgi:hypothetical protein
MAQDTVQRCVSKDSIPDYQLPLECRMSTNRTPVRVSGRFILLRLHLAFRLNEAEALGTEATEGESTGPRG